MCSLSTLSWSHNNMSFGPGTLSWQGGLTACAARITLSGYLFLCFSLNVSSFVWLMRVCVIEHLANLTAGSVSCKEGMGSFVLWHKGGGACRPIAPFQVLRGTC